LADPEVEDGRTSLEELDAPEHVVGTGLAHVLSQNAGHDARH
jgi:hypothetical protein